MCGFVALCELGRVFDAPLLDRIAADLHHRGPDSGGTLSEPGIALAFRRLAILDPAAGADQPMTDASGRLTIVFNGEIYNYLEIRERLKQEGVVFRSDSDTEVLLAAYQKWGENCLAELNGMFAFAIFDSKRRVLFCARDRFGEKPFLFHAANDRFAFASEFKALFTLEGVATSHDSLRLLSFLQHPTRGLDDGTNTVFDDIQQLPPAHSLTLDLDQLTYQIRRYWDVRPNPDFARLSQSEAEEH